MSKLARAWMRHYLSPVSDESPSSAQAILSQLPHLKKHGVAGIISHLALQHGHKAPELKTTYQEHFIHTASFLSETQALGNAFTSHNLKVILLKGGHLIQSVYREELGYRPVSDLDLLVTASDLPRLKEVLASLRYQQVPYASYIWRSPEGFELDLHTSLLSRAEPVFNLDLNDIFDTAQPLRNTGIYVLSPNYLALHLMVHALKHGFTRLIWSVDIIKVFRQLDRLSFLQLVQQTKASKALAYTEAILDQQLNYSFPKSWYRSMHPLSTLDRYFVQQFCEENPSETLGMVALFFVALHPKNKWEYLKSLCKPYLEEQSLSRRLIDLLTSTVRTLSNLVKKSDKR